MTLSPRYFLHQETTKPAEAGYIEEVAKVE
jgi:hypothetical protein